MPSDRTELSRVSAKQSGRIRSRTAFFSFGGASATSFFHAWTCARIWSSLSDLAHDSRSLIRATTGESPTSTAAHAAANLPRIRSSLRPGWPLSTAMIDWDERFSRGDELYGGLPSPPLPQAIKGIAPGTALDLASGAGRHSLYL